MKLQRLLSETTKHEKIVKITTYICIEEVNITEKKIDRNGHFELRMDQRQVYMYLTRRRKTGYFNN